MLKFAAKWSALMAALVLTVGGAQIAVAADKPFAEKKIVLQISDPNPFKQTLVLNVANNLVKEYGPDKVAIEVVAFGPGVRLLFADNANVGRIKALSEGAGVTFHACSNTITNMTKLLGEAPEINAVAAKSGPGVVRIVKLVTEDGYTLVKP
jgi:intracellular sulfur oxidation DsrE/DsrF family protein